MNSHSTNFRSIDSQVKWTRIYNRMNNATAMRKERQKKKKNRKGHSGRKDRVQSAAERQVADDFIFSRAAAAAIISLAKSCRDYCRNAAGTLLRAIISLGAVTICFQARINAVLVCDITKVNFFRFIKM